MQEKRITYQSGEIFYRVTGHGPVVVLLHGFGEDGEVWKEQVSALSASNKLIIPDLPGSGRSSLLKDVDAGLEAYANAVKFLLDHEHTGSFHLMGHSMGGYIALAFAELYPQHIKGLGLIHSSAYADNAEKKATREKAIAFMEKNGAYEFLKTSIPGLFGPVFTGLQPARIERLIEEGKQFTTEALIQYYRAMIARPDRTAILRDAAFPILFLLGVHDKAVPFDQGLQQSYLPSVSHVHILRDSGHMGIWEEPEKSNLALRALL